MLDALKILGAVAGLVSFSILIWDRITRQWPIAVLISKERVAPGGDRTLSLRVINNSERPILLEFGGQRAPDYMRVWPDSSTMSAVSDEVGARTVLVVDDHQTVDLPIRLPKELMALPQDRKVYARVFWRTAQPSIWIWHWRHTFRVSILRGDIDALRSNKYLVVIGDEDPG